MPDLHLLYVVYLGERVVFISDSVDVVLLVLTWVKRLAEACVGLRLRFNLILAEIGASVGIDTASLVTNLVGGKHVRHTG